MLTSNGRVAFRHLVNQKLYTLLNVAGLAVGLACFVLIALFVRHELGFDRGWQNADRIYRISRDFLPTDVSKAAYLATAAPQIAPLLAEDFAAIEAVARVARFSATFRADDGTLHVEPDAASADSAFVSIFDFEWLRGDARRALAAPQSVVLTRSAARKYFGEADPLGRTLQRNDGTPTWGFNAFYTYALLRPGADPGEISRGSNDFFERRFQEGSSRWTRLDVMPVRDIHLNSHKENEMRAPGSARTVRTFAAVAVFILLLACINFMNLATARASQRAREIGVRKAVGADRSQIVAQFLAESVLVAGLALLLAMAIVEVTLPPFNAFLGTSIELRYLDDPGALIGLAALTLLTGLLAGSYPAFYLAAFEPGSVLKGDATRGGGAAVFRRGLVVLQFAISITLLIATGVVYQQTRFARDIELGYDTERVVVVAGTVGGGLGAQWDTLRREWLAHPGVLSVTASNLVPGMENTDAEAIVAEGAGLDTGAGVTNLVVDYGFFETYGIRVVTGRAFDEQLGVDRASVAAGAARPGTYVISEGLARRYGWTPEQALGKWLAIASAPQSRGPVVGVVEDIHFESIRSAIEPTVYMLPPEGLPFQRLQYASIKVAERDLPSVLKDIDATWAKLMPDEPIVRRFLDDSFAALYAAEQRQGTMFTLFSVLAVAIALLGLFGLASFTTERRTKEIGIRKVIGGSVLDVVRLFTAEFSTLVLLANVLAWPAAYWLMQRWLQGFAYRIDIGFGVFAASGLAALALAWLTVGAVAARAAAARPIASLRDQ